MMIMDKILKGAEEDHSKSLQERVFSIVPVIGLGTIFIMIFIGIMVEDDLVNSIMLALCFLLFFAVISISIKKKRVQTGATIIALVLILFLLPVSFVFGGGIYGGSPLWFVFGFAYIGMTVEGKRKYVLMGIGGITSALAYYVAYSYPHLVAVHTEFAAHLDSFLSVILVSGLLTLMILLENRVYMSETRLIEKQKKEIEELSTTRNLFFSNVSHEIRTPLDSIMGFNEVILRETESDSVRESAENIRSASKMLMALINDVLDVSKLEAGKMEINPIEYDFIDMFSEVINMCRMTAVDKGLEMTVDIDPQLPRRLVGDDIRIQQILINIINNSIKFTEEGSVSVSVIANNRFDNHVDIVFSIEDTGIGIKRGEISSIFDEFKRVNQRENKGIEGTGLGLVIVKQLTEQMNGQIQVNSIYTKGSTFVITIPQEVFADMPVGLVSMEDLRKHKEQYTYIPGFEAPSARLLIVDDDQMNRTVTARLLKETKIRIDQAASGVEALEKTIAHRYDCIFMDQVMAEMDGMECLRMIRQQIGGLCAETPVIAITAYSTADEQAKFRMAGFDGYLLKPLSGEVLEKTLLRVLPAELTRKIGKKSTVSADLEYGGKHKDKLPILISTESICDLPKDFLEKMSIPVIPYIVNNKNGSFIDGVEAETDGVLEYMADGGSSDLTTEPPSITEYEEFFAAHLSDADNIIHICMTGKASAAFNQATEAASSFDKVNVIDSESLSCGMGLLVLEAVRMVQSGKNVQECIAGINSAKKRIHTSFLINDVDYLYRFGRISANMRGLSRIFLMHPSIIFRDGRGGLDKMLIGASEKVRKRYIKMQLDSTRPIDRSKLFVVHAGLSTVELDDILRMVRDRVIFDEVYVQKESAATAAIHGTGALGLLFMYDEV